MKRKTLKATKNKGGADFGPISYNKTDMSPYTTYDINSYNQDPSRSIQSARNLMGGKKRRKTIKKNRTKRRMNGKKNKGGLGITPFRHNLFYNSYGYNNPSLI